MDVARGSRRNAKNDDTAHNDVIKVPMSRTGWRDAVRAWWGEVAPLLKPLFEWPQRRAGRGELKPEYADVEWLIAETGWLGALEPADRERVLRLAGGVLLQVELVAPQAAEVQQFWAEALRAAAAERAAPAPSDEDAARRLPWWIAVHVAWPVLELGLDALGTLRSIILYPDTFVPDHEWIDDDGIVHRERAPHAGEAWEDGPMVLSVADVWAEPAVIVHEVAHVLDAGNGAVNGFPPLAPGQDPKRWTRVFEAAYRDLVARVERGEVADGDATEDASAGSDDFDAYGATLPEEFFAVAVEHFFFQPERVKRPYPDVFAELRRYFRFDPETMRRANDAFVA